ncbi:type II toxin-antitoxin system VapC family toxin [Lutibaculum baratangense]|uniref:Ribonuclease VapC n=1 Tax=Lutibaculum baratangense AMV1 TaxID=631454 RepID=V4RUJ4_9HYPH|nr:type II toxin-antitoxin system VapC family toxin [Lutibaculum baratangense]ESR26745.1 PilT protein domain protein [Lutibaculum baratangense AMV1]
MIVVDTSALMAILLREPRAEACDRALEQTPDLIMPTGTMTEALIVATRRGVRGEMELMLGSLGLDIVPVTAATAKAAASAYVRWGKGMHPARLNFGDCFAYQEAMERRCPLLYVGNDFAQTDVQSAL